LSVPVQAGIQRSLRKLKSYFKMHKFLYVIFLLSIYSCSSQMTSQSDFKIKNTNHDNFIKSYNYNDGCLNRGFLITTNEVNEKKLSYEISRFLSGNLFDKSCDISYSDSMVNSEIY